MEFENNATIVEAADVEQELVMSDPSLEEETVNIQLEDAVF
jgi:hypothetical protein